MNRGVAVQKIAITGGALALVAAGTLAAQPIPIGHLATYTGPTSDVGKPYGQGIADALAYVNKLGGVAGRPLKFESVDYSYETPKAIAAYRRWVAQDKVVAVQGWGTADTEALVTSVAKDQVPYFSASYSGYLTDPAGKGSKGASPAPFNFFYGPSYTDGCRALVQWAAEDARKKGIAKPKFMHMGDNHPYPNAPREGCGAYAAELGFEMRRSIPYSLKPIDFKPHCQNLRDTGAQYVFLANTSSSNIALLKSCQGVGVKAQFMANVWGMDEAALKDAGDAANGVVFVGGAADWKSEAPGMKTVREVSRMSDPSGAAYRPLHYLRGVCSVFYMRDAMAAAAKAGGITGPAIKKAMESMKNHVPADLQGVCLPSTWTSEDHRGTSRVIIYEASAKGATQSVRRLAEVDIPRKPEWLGW